MLPELHKHRSKVMRWLRRWLYRLVCEQASIAGEIALWMPTDHCWWCGYENRSGSCYCAMCGIAQRHSTQTTGGHEAMMETTQPRMVSSSMKRGGQ